MKTPEELVRDEVPTGHPLYHHQCVHLMRVFADQEVKAFKEKVIEELRKEIEIRHKVIIEEDFNMAQALALQGVLSRIQKL